MHEPPAGAYAKDSPYRSTPHVEVCVFPTLLDWQGAAEAGLVYGAQYGRAEPSGAFTGDVSMQMLKHQRFHYVLCGHSERRMHHAESDEVVALQAAAAVAVGLHPIVCIGETADEREMGQTKDVVLRQLAALSALEHCTIAYEPVWAIGNGKTATVEQAQEMHAYIRSQLPAHHRADVRIMYGGSAKPDNAEHLLQQEDIDGLLVGACSLDPAAFGKIVEIAANTR